MSNGRYLYEKAAQSILTWFHLAEDDLLGHTVVTFNGETGVVKELRADASHGLCFTFDDFDALDPSPRRFYPVSTIRLHGPKA